jgi:hypothetical protein
MRNWYAWVRPLLRLFVQLRIWLARRFAQATLVLRHRAWKIAAAETPAGAKGSQPVRSTKADAKRQMLAFARKYYCDPTMTWAAAKKRIKRLEALERRGGVTPEMSRAIATALAAD